MTHKEANLRVFTGEPLERVFHQPRFEPWCDLHKQRGTLPDEISEMGIMEVYDHLGVSMRYMQYYTGLPDPVVRDYSDKVKGKWESNDEESLEIIDTPHGQLTRRSKKTIDNAWRTVEFPVKRKEDLAAFSWFLDNLNYGFSKEKFLEGEKTFGDRGEAQFFIPKSPYQALCLEWMKQEDFFLLLIDAPAEVEVIMAKLDERYDPFYEQLCAAQVTRVGNFGENLHSQFIPPEYLEKYLIPFWQKRCAQLKKAGIYTHVHLDGYFKPLLKYFKDLPFDGLEALTPEPQGDVSIEEMKEYIGDKVLLDGIPAMYFMPQHTDEELEEATKKIIKLFHPRLVLGISDELPQGTGQVGWERLKWVEKYCREYRP